MSIINAGEEPQGRNWLELEDHGDYVSREWRLIDGYSSGDSKWWRGHDAQMVLI